MKKTNGFLIILFVFSVLFLQNLSAWEPTIRMTWNAGDSRFPKIAANDSSGKLHVVWIDDFQNTNNDYDLYYKQSPDTGNNWGPTQRITWNSSIFKPPEIAVDVFDRIHIVWEKKGLLSYRRSVDGGSTWSQVQTLVWSYNTWYPFITSDSDGNIYFFWSDSKSTSYAHLYLLKSTNGGVSWGAANQLTWGTRNSNEPYVAVDSNDSLHMVWEGHTPDFKTDIFYKNLLYNARGWSTPTRITWTNSCFSPVIAADTNNHLYVIWINHTDIFYKKSIDAGYSWFGLKRLTWNSKPYGNVNMVINSSNTIHVVWDDNMSGNVEIYFKYSSNGGTTWSTTSRITWNQGSADPSTSIDKDGNLQLVWTGNSEIYHKALIGGSILRK